MARSATQMEALEVLDTITLVIGVILLVVATVAPCIVAWLIIKERSRPGAQSKVADLYSRLVGGAGWSHGPSRRGMAALPCPWET